MRCARFGVQGVQPVDLRAAMLLGVVLEVRGHHAQRTEGRFDHHLDAPRAACSAPAPPARAACAAARALPAGAKAPGCRSGAARSCRGDRWRGRRRPHSRAFRAEALPPGLRPRCPPSRESCARFPAGRTRPARLSWLRPRCASDRRGHPCRDTTARSNSAGAYRITAKRKRACNRHCPGRKTLSFQAIVLSTAPIMSVAGGNVAAGLFRRWRIVAGIGHRWWRVCARRAPRCPRA